MTCGTPRLVVSSVALFLSVVASAACETNEFLRDADVRDSSATDAMMPHDGSNDTDSDPGMDVSPHPECPALSLSVGTSGLEIARSIESKPNLFESNHLGWGISGDDTVLIEARQTGTYIVGVGVSGSDVPEGLGVAVPEAAEFYTSDMCPVQGMTRSLPNARLLATADESGSLELEKGDEALLISSCSAGCERAGFEYTLTIQRQCSPTCG